VTYRISIVHNHIAAAMFVHVSMPILVATNITPFVAHDVLLISDSPIIVSITVTAFLSALSTARAAAIVVAAVRAATIRTVAAGGSVVMMEESPMTAAVATTKKAAMAPMCVRSLARRCE
jgi:hypothetical protein